MFSGKSGFVVRSLFVSFLVGSLVACTFESTPEDQGHSTSADSKSKKAKNAADASADDVDADVGVDGGPHKDGGGGGGNDDADVDGGPGDWDDVDGGPADEDGGPYEGAEDAGPANNDW